MPTAKSPGTLSSDTFRKFAAQSIFVDNCFNGGPGRLLLKESLRWRQLGQGAIRDHGKSLHVNLFSYLLEEEQSNVNLKTIPRQCLVYVTEFEPYFPQIPYVRPFSTYWSINCFHAWYYLEENSHFVSFLTSEELTSLGNWDWIQFEELKCLHTKELISFLASKLATFLENCKIYSLHSNKKSLFLLDEITC